MENTVNKAQFKKITTTLITGGDFAISDMEKGNNLSREQIGKILKKLTEKQILTKSAKRGAKVTYKLTKTEQGLQFLLQNIIQATIEDIANAWNVSVASAKKYIKPFVDNNIIEKIGRPPKKINYVLAQNRTNHDLGSQENELIEKYFSVITPAGRYLEGVNALEYFIKEKYGQQNLDQNILNVARSYLSTRKEYYNYDGEKQLIDNTKYFQNIFQENFFVEKIFHSDFKKLPEFNDSNLYQLIKIAKAGQTNLDLMLNVLSQITNDINQIINTYDIEAVAFIPPTIMRKMQVMTFWRDRLNIQLPQIQLIKNPGLLPVQQKNLKTLKSRSIHAKESIQLKSQPQPKQYEKVLVIDDIADSGATLNETAKKLFNQNIAQKVYAFTAVGPVKQDNF